MAWPFKRKPKDDMSVDSLLATANQASPTPAAPTAAPVVAPTDGSFRMPVEDVFSITGRGTVVTGTVEAGTISVGQSVNLVRGGAVVRSVTVAGVEMFRKLLDTATVGQNVGLLLKGVSREDVQRGDLLTS